MTTCEDSEFIQKIKNNDPDMTIIACKLISDTGVLEIVEAMKENTTVISMDFSNMCFIGYSGVIAIAKLLETNEIITSLNLKGNDVRNEGAISLAEMLTKNNTLTSLNLTYTRIGGEGMKAIVISMSKNTTLTELHIGHNFSSNEANNEIAKMIKDNSSLIALSVFPHENRDTINEILKSIEFNSSLEFINIGIEIDSRSGEILENALNSNTALMCLTYHGTQNFNDFRIRDCLERNRNNRNVKLMSYQQHCWDVVKTLPIEEIEAIPKSMRVQFESMNKRHRLI